MCAVIGVKLFNVTEEQLAIVKEVFLQSKIRGKHATGVSFIKNGEIETIKESVPADEFFEIHSISDFVDNGNLTLIGHCRYSTSDLNYNQPMTTDGLSIVHNGVITQELPENWKALYGHDCETRNDSELILYTENALVEFNHMSMGVCELRSEGSICFYRNGKRPLYFTSLDNGVIITSTADIAERSGLKNPTMATFNSVYFIDDDGVLNENTQFISNEDLQVVNY